MLVFIVKRLLWMLPFLVAISFLSFVLIQLPPGDYVTTYIATLAASNEVVDQNTAADLRNRFGLDQPMVVQYWKWISNIAFRGDFGLSFEWQQPVGDLIWERMALTLLLTLSALLMTWGIALPVGVFSAVKKYSIADYVVTGLSFLGLAIPSFLLALVLMYIAAVHFGQNVGGLFSEQYLTAPWSVDKVIDLLQHLWIPVVILAVSGTASLIRVMRANMLDELHEVMSEQFEHEERAVFPCLEAGAAPIHVLGDLHDRHDDVADRLRRLALLTEELPAAIADPDLAALRAGFRALDALACGHHALERDALLTRFS